MSTEQLYFSRRHVMTGALTLAGACLFRSADAVLAHSTQSASRSGTDDMNSIILAADGIERKRALGLVRIGEDGIAKENDAALNAYFARNFVLHSPEGDVDFESLKRFFASMRSAFSGFSVTRPAIIVKGDYVSARTVMAGTFTNVFDLSPIGPVQPTGRLMRRELMNFFRYDAQGRLAEEWVQSDNIAFLRELGVEMKPTTHSR